MSSGKCKLKQQGHTTTHPLEWPKSRRLTTPNAGEDVEQQELSFVAGGMQNGTATLEDSLAVFTKLNILLYNPAIVLLCIYPKELKTYVHAKASA